MSTKPIDQAAALSRASSQIPVASFRRACRQMGLETRLEQVILVRGDEVIVGDWGADPDAAAAVVRLVRSTWDPSTPSVQIQYAFLEGYDEPLLHYSSPVDDCLLTLVARNSVTLSALRRIADKLSAILCANGGNGRGLDEELLSQLSANGEERGNGVYAIAWRPVEPLPQAIRKIVRESARRLARNMGCHLTFVGVASDHVHLVLHCPPHRNGSWAAYAFKNGIEIDIGRRYGTSATLWRKGFLADPSAGPIGGEELLAYLSH